MNEEVQTGEQSITLDAASPLVIALKHHQAGRLAEAEAIYQELIQCKAPMPEAFYLMSEIALQREQFEQAIEFLARAINAAPAVCEYRLRLGRIYKSLGQLDLAIACYAQALELQADNASTHYELANALLDQGRINEAIDAYNRSIAINPWNVGAHNNLGNATKAQGKFEEAIACYRKALSLDPKSAFAHFNLAVVLQEQRKFDDAIASYRAAIACKAGYVEAFCNLGVVLKEQGKQEEALKYYQAALAINPNWVNALFNIGNLCELNKQLSQAEQWYRKALSVDPNFVPARVNLTNMLFNDERFEESQWHRDYAYRRQCLFFIPAVAASRTVLILQDSTNGNVPTQFLFPVAENNLIASVNRIEWVIEYASDDQYRQLPDYDFVFNAIGDADVIDRSSKPLAHFMGQCNKPVLNSPEAVARTARHLMPQLFSGLQGIVIPRIWRVEQTGDWSANPEFCFPMLVRPLVSHGGKGVIFVKDREELARVEMKQCKAIYLTAFHDYCSSDGYFRKYRIIFIDRKPYPYHLAISTHWLVHYDTSDMSSSWKLEEEKRFFADPRAVLGEKNMRVIEAIGERMDLDYGGVDFSVLPDGSLLLFEANATMLAHPEDEKEELLFKNPYIQKIYGAFAELLNRVCKTQ